MLAPERLPKFRAKALETAQEIDPKATEDEDGDIVFRSGFLFVIVFDPHDPPFTRILLPNFHKAPPGQGKVLAASNQINQRNKTVKISASRDGVVSASIEFFATGTELSRDHLERCVGALEEGVKEFRKLVGPPGEATHWSRPSGSTLANDHEPHDLDDPTSEFDLGTETGKRTLH